MYVVLIPKMVFAFIPGTIVKIYVKEKHRVKKVILSSLSRR